MTYSVFRDSETPWRSPPAGTLMILKSACSNNPSYIDRLISVFMRSLQKMVREHLSPQAASGSTEAASGDALGRPHLGPPRLAAPLPTAFVFIIICS